MIELSVALITYNNEPYIEETLNSLVEQQCSFNFEVVVGDDCSTDKTFEILQLYQKKYPEIFKIKQNPSQLGILNNFKSTLDRCTGTYIFNFDGDDVIKDTKALEKLVTVFKKKPYLGFVDSGYDKYYQEHKTVDAFVNKDTITASKDQYRDCIYLGKVIPIGTCFNRKLILQHVDYKTYLSKKITIEDYPMLVDMAANCDFERINESLFTYRIHPQSYSYKSGFDRYFFLRNEMLGLFNHFSEKYKFNSNLRHSYYQKHYKRLLYLAGAYEKKNLGKDTFTKIKSKDFQDYIHYLASQSKIFRKLVGLRKIKNILAKKIRLSLK